AANAPFSINVQINNVRNDPLTVTPSSPATDCIPNGSSYSVTEPGSNPSLSSGCSGNTVTANPISCIITNSVGATSFFATGNLGQFSTGSSAVSPGIGTSTPTLVT